jgi:hypothetical protein
MNKLIKKSSEEWFKELYEGRIEIMDPDGWDRYNFDYSWYDEKIDIIEFEKRLMVSTLRIMDESLINLTMALGIGKDNV